MTEPPPLGRAARALAAAAAVALWLAAAPALAAMPAGQLAATDIERSELERGIAALQGGDLGTARHYLERVVRRDPQEPDALAALGEVYLRQGDRDSAFQYVEAALIVDPDHRGALAAMGMLYLDMSNLAEAERKAAQLAAVCASGCAERQRLEDAIAAFKGERRGS